MNCTSTPTVLSSSELLLLEIMIVFKTATLISTWKQCAPSRFWQISSPYLYQVGVDYAPLPLLIFIPSYGPVILRTPFARNHASAWESISLSLGKLCKNRSNAFQSSNPSRLLYGLACLIESLARATNWGGQFRARWAIYLVSFWLFKIECISK